jgi:hypothetical protein
LSAISYPVLTGVGSVCRECDEFAVPPLEVVEAAIRDRLPVLQVPTAATRVRTARNVWTNLGVDGRQDQR